MQEKNDDIVIEDDPDSTAPAEAQHKLREKLKQAEAKAKEYLDGWQRSQADFVNLRKRDEEAKVEFIKFANLSFMEELIPVLDSFNIAKSGGHKDFEPLYNQLVKVLKANGLEEISPIGEIFSPHEHEALGMIPTHKHGEDHKVLEVLQKGYKLNGRVIRPAKVKVGEFISN